jgi:hypothetical protein
MDLLLDLPRRHKEPTEPEFVDLIVNPSPPKTRPPAQSDLVDLTNSPPPGINRQLQLYGNNIVFIARLYLLTTLYSEMKLRYILLHPFEL